MVLTLKTVWSRGEFSPKAHSRVDLQMYAGGCARLDNWLPLPQGGIARRPGTRYAGEVKTSANLTSLIPFVYSTDQSYVIEAGNLYFRFWTQGGQVIDSGSPVEVVTPYTTADLADLKFVQSGNVLYLTHPSYAPRKLVRNSHTSWTLSVIEFVDGPWLPINETATTVSVDFNPPGLINAGAIGSTTANITFSGTAGINGGAGFTNADVGRLIRMRSSATAGVGQSNGWATFKITSRTSSTVVVATLTRIGMAETGKDTYAAPTAAAPSPTWRLDAFNAYEGYPSAVQLADGRLAYAATNMRPRAVWLSRSGIPEDFGPSFADSTTAADLAIFAEISVGRGDKILWMYEGARLLLGTRGGIRSIGASDFSQALSISNIKQTLELPFGVENIDPVPVGSNLIVVGRFGLSLRDVYYDFQVNQIVGPNISTISEHVLLAGVEQLAYCQEPDSIIWGRTGDGDLFSLTYNRPESVMAFAPHSVTGEVESIASIPGTDYDELWMIVRRTVNGQTKRYVEVMQRLAKETDAIEDSFFCDCGATYSGAATNVVSGLSHLRGLTVSILADGFVFPNQVVSAGGTITLPNGYTATKVQVGLPIDSDCELLRPPLQKPDGSALGVRQRATVALVEVLASGGLRVGTRNMDPEYAWYREADYDVDEPQPLRTGTFEVNLEDKWDDGAIIRLRVTDPLPCFVRSVNTRVEIED